MDPLNAVLARALLGAGFLLAPPLSAELPLAFPLDCTLGQDCHIQNYVDHDSGRGFVDFACGSLGYDRHKGTDFALPSDLDIRSGVAVRAVAGGVVRGVRDGMADRRFDRDKDADAIRGRECGNGVLIDHGDGWESQYCHLRRGSVDVAPGDTVLPGTRLGEVGLSGKTEFPHLHLAVRHDDTVVDPFWPNKSAFDRCDRSPDPEDQLWSDPIDYVASGWISAGFSPAVPEFDAIKDGTVVTQTPRHDSSLVLWAFAFGGQSNQRIRLEIFGPDGDRLHLHDFILDRPQAQLFRAAGLRRPDDGWPSGAYTGRYSLISPDDAVIATGETVWSLR